MKNRNDARQFTAARSESSSPGAHDGGGGYGTLHHTVVDQIGKKIVRGEFQPGEALPNADDLSKMMGISRTVLREAVKVLAGKGLVVSRPKTGTRVRPRGDWNFLDSDILLWRYAEGPTETDVNALFELRRAIEPMAAALAAKNATPDQIDTINAALAEMEVAGDDGALFAEPDLVFHRTILRMTGNELIGSLGALIATALMMSFRLSDANPAGHRHSLPMHREVVRRIIDGDGPGARDTVSALIDGAEHDVRRGLALQNTASRQEEGVS